MPPGQIAAPRPAGGDLTAGGPRPQRRAAAIFRRRMLHAASRVGLRLCIARQNSRRPPSSAGAPAARGAAPDRLPSGDRLAGRDGRGQSHEGITMTTDRDDNPHTSSPTAHVLTELHLFGGPPSKNDPDPLPFPGPRFIGAASPNIFDPITKTCRKTPLNP